MPISVCVLAYGDYPELAQRCLSSIRDSQPTDLADLRIGLNAVGAATRAWVFEFCARVAFPCIVYEPPQNTGKYAMMRRMLYDPDHAPADLLMWFDDDSYIETRGRGSDWWTLAAAYGRRYVVSGAVHTIPQRQRQYLGIQSQPWYTGKPVGLNHVYNFVTGGWWVGQRDFLWRWSYPFPDLFHNGGDSILGELARQQGQPLGRFPHAHCHCEACQKKPKALPPDVVHINVGGRKGRRGLGVALREEVYVWQNYGLSEPSWAHHDFSCYLHAFGCQ